MIGINFADLFVRINVISYIMGVIFISQPLLTEINDSMILLFAGDKGVA